MNGLKSIDDAQVCAGRLMSPEELRIATAGHAGLPGPLDGWCLCGDASVSMFDALAESGGVVGSRLTGFVGPAGGSYMVVTHQLRTSQHRFLLPLYEPLVASFLKWLEHYPMRIMLGRRGQSDAIVMHNRMVWSDLQPLVAMCQPEGSVDAAAMAAESLLTAASVCRPDTIPSFHAGIDVSDISVSVVLPTSLGAYDFANGDSFAGGLQ
jgi:hypothetical protein